MLEIRVVNVSALPRALPVSQDGVKLVTKCPDHTVLQGGDFLGQQGGHKILPASESLLWMRGIFSHPCASRPGRMDDVCNEDHQLIDCQKR